MRRPADVTRTATPVPYTALFRSRGAAPPGVAESPVGWDRRRLADHHVDRIGWHGQGSHARQEGFVAFWLELSCLLVLYDPPRFRSRNNNVEAAIRPSVDRKSTRLNSRPQCAYRMPSSSCKK